MPLLFSVQLIFKLQTYFITFLCDYVLPVTHVHVMSKVEQMGYVESCMLLENEPVHEIFHEIGGGGGGSWSGYTSKLH